VKLLQPAEQRHVNTTTFEQQLASCALPTATFIDNFGSVRQLQNQFLKLGSGDRTRGQTAGPVFRFGLQCHWCPLIGQPIYKTREVLGSAGSLACASVQATLPPLGGVASLGLPRLGNPGNRGMEATLGLRAPPTALQGLRSIVLSQVRRDSGPAWEEKLLPRGRAV
jgi:hypothetical protein